MSNLVSTIITAQLKITIKCLSTTYYIRCIRNIYYKSSCFWMCKLGPVKSRTTLEFQSILEQWSYSPFPIYIPKVICAVIWRYEKSYRRIHAAKLEECIVLHYASEGGGSLTEEASWDILEITYFNSDFIEINMCLLSIASGVIQISDEMSSHCKTQICPYENQLGMKNFGTSFVSTSYITNWFFFVNSDERGRRVESLKSVISW